MACSDQRSESQHIREGSSLRYGGCSGLHSAHSCFVLSRDLCTKAKVRRNYSREYPSVVHRSESTSTLPKHSYKPFSHAFKGKQYPERHYISMSVVEIPISPTTAPSGSMSPLQDQNRDDIQRRRQPPLFGFADADGGLGDRELGFALIPRLF